MRLNSNGNLFLKINPTLETLPTQILTRDAATGEVKYVPSTSFGGSGTEETYIQASPSVSQNTFIDISGGINARGESMLGGPNTVTHLYAGDNGALHIDGNNPRIKIAGSLVEPLTSYDYVVMENDGVLRKVSSSRGDFIKASPSTPQNANIDITGSIQNGGFYSAPGSIGLLAAPIGGTNHPNIAIGDHDTGINWYGDGDIALRGNGNDFIRFSQGSLLYFPVNPQLDVLPTQILTRNSNTGEVKYVPSTSFVSGSNSNAFSLDFPSVSQNQNADLTVTVTGAEIGDVVSLGLPNSVMAGLSWNAGFNAWVSATNTVTIRFQNHDPSSAHDLPAASFKVKVMK